jgi:hypothetical protein
MHVFSRTEELSLLLSSSSSSSNTTTSLLSSSLQPLSTSGIASLPTKTETTTTTTIATFSSLTTTAGHVSLLMPYGPLILSRLLQWLASLADPRQHGRATRLLGLELVNTVLETGGGALGTIPSVLGVIQADLCKFLIANSRTLDLPTLSLALRVVFNLFASLKQYLKVQLEVFLTSVHLFLADSRTAPPEQKELALESLLEFCKEPSMMIDLYVNFDCDVACANLFEALCRCLCRCSVPEIGTPITSLHAIALDGILSVISSMAQRCPGHPAWRQRSGLFFPSSVVGQDALLVASASINRMFDSDSSSSTTTLVDGGTGGASGGTMGHSKLREESAAVLRTRRQLKKRLALGAAKFNTDQKGWIEVLQELGLLPTPADAPSVAKFLLECPSLDRVLVGLYLSEPPDAKHVFNAAVRNSYVTSFKFTGLRIDDALRVFLESFRLPGEAQKIERLMLAFSEHFFAESPGPMHHADTAFVLAYSIIMLNTDLHNRQVRKKMTVEQFVSNNRGIDCGNNLPPEYLSAIYASILEKEIMLRADAPQYGASSLGSVSGSSTFSSTGSGSSINLATSSKESNVSPNGGSSGNRSSSTLNSTTPAVESEAGQQLGTQWDGVLRRQNTVLSYTPSGASLSGVSQSRFGRGRAGSGQGTQVDSALNTASEQRGGAGGGGGSGHIGVATSIATNGNEEPPMFVLAGAHERDMFLLIVEPCLHAIITVFETTRDPAVLRRAAVGFRDVALLAAYYNMSGPINALVVAISRSALSDMDAISDLDENDIGVFEFAKSVVRSFVKSKKKKTSLTLTETNPESRQSPVLNEATFTSALSSSTFLVKATNFNTSTKSPSSSPPLSPFRPASSSGQQNSDGSFEFSTKSPQISTPAAPSLRGSLHSNLSLPSDAPTPLLSIDLLSKGGSSRQQQHANSAAVAVSQSSNILENTEGDIDIDDSSSLYSLLVDGDIDSMEVNLSFSSSFQGDSAYLLRRMLLALRLLLHISSSHPELLREGWKNVSEVVLRLSVNECLPSGFLQLDDFRAANGMILPSVSDENENEEDNTSFVPFVLSGSRYIRELFASLTEKAEKDKGEQTRRLQRLIESPLHKGSIGPLSTGTGYDTDIGFEISTTSQQDKKSTSFSNPQYSALDRDANSNNSNKSGGGIWESLTSFFGGFVETVESSSDVNTDAVLTAVACEVSRTQAPFLLLSKSAALPDETVTQFLHSLVTVRSPATLGQTISGGGSSLGMTSKENSSFSQSNVSNPESGDLTTIVSAITIIEIVAEISLQNAHRPQITMPLVLFYYKTLIANAVPISTHTSAVLSKEACYVGERIVVNLMRIAARALTIDEAWVRDQQNTTANSLGVRYLQQQDPQSIDVNENVSLLPSSSTADDVTTISSSSPTTTTFTSSVPSHVQTSQSPNFISDFDTPLSVVTTCLRVITAFPEPLFAVCAPRIAAGVSFLVHIGPNLSHLVPLMSPASSYATNSNSQQSKDLTLKLKIFFDNIFSLLERCNQRFLASPGVWDTLVRLASSVNTLTLVTSTPIGSPLRECLFSLHIDVMHETQRFLLRHLLPSTSDEIISGCAAAVLLSDHQGHQSGHDFIASGDSGNRLRDLSASGLTRKHAAFAAQSSSSLTMSSTSSSASSAFSTTLRSLIAGQSTSELRVFTSNAVLRLYESLALNINITSEFGAEDLWISSVCGLRDVAASLGSLSVSSSLPLQSQGQNYCQSAVRSAGAVQRLIFGTLQRLVAGHPKRLSFQTWSDFFNAVSVLQKSSLSCSLLSTEQTQQPLLDLAEAVVQVNAISGKGIWHASCSISLSVSEFLVLWTFVLNELLEQISTCALAESRFVVNRPPSTTAASRNLITESLQDDVRKLFIVIGTKTSSSSSLSSSSSSPIKSSVSIDQSKERNGVSLLEQTNEQGDVIQEQQVILEPPLVLSSTIWSRVQELLPPSLVNELRIAATGGSNTRSVNVSHSPQSISKQETETTETSTTPRPIMTSLTNTTKGEEFEETSNLHSPPSLKRNALLTKQISGLLAPAPELRGFASATSKTDIEIIDQQTSKTSGGSIFSFLF